MASYQELITTVRDWTNRDSSVLPDSVVKSNLRYAADEAYRQLKIPPMEYVEWYLVNDGSTRTLVQRENPQDSTFYKSVSSAYTDISMASYESTGNSNVEHITMCVPEDTISFIYLRASGRSVHPPIGSYVDGVLVSESNQSTFIEISQNKTPLVIPNSDGKHIVYNEKSNIRNLYDFSNAYDVYGFWARRGNQLIAAGDIDTLDMFELVYYRRLPALNAREEIPATLTLAAAQADPTNYEVIDATAWNALSAYEADTYTALEGSYVRSTAESQNWLKDENEKILLFGALYRCFDYLQEDQQAEKYKQRFIEAIAELNKEEKDRQLSGGAMTMTFTSGNLI